MEQITVTAETEQIEVVTGFVDAILEGIDCPFKAQMQIDVAIDEIFSNVVHYAYPDAAGEVTVGVEMLEGMTGIRLIFSDAGIPYNPLEKDDPDVTLSAEERQIGGLGIYIVKKTMDAIEYQHADGLNILTITKNF